MNDVVCITGASSDLSRAIFETYYETGCNYVLCDMNEQENKMREIYGHYGEEGRARISYEVFDLTAVNEYSFLDKYEITVLVNCAGVNIFKRFIEIQMNEWDQIMDVNLKGTFFLTQAVAARMIRNKIKGRIVNIGSQHGVVANGLRAPYCVSKFGLVGMTKVLALELAVHGIRVNCVSSTYIYTEKSSEFLDEKQVKVVYLSKIPLCKYARPHDIANAVFFLADCRNGMITGENLIVDGGYTIH